MVPPGDGEHAHEVKGGADADGYLAPTDDEHAEADQVDRDERNGPQPVDGGGGSISLHVFDAGPRIKPVHNRQPGCVARGLGYRRLFVGFGQLTVFG